MPQSTLSRIKNHSHLRLIGEEDSPIYDDDFRSQSPVVEERRHMTVIVDDVVETIAGQHGLAALGLYTLLERRANTDGFAFGSYQDWAEMGSMTRRHVIRLMEELVSGGWVKKQERTNQFGMQRTNAWELPFHRKPRTYGGDTHGDIDSDTTRQTMSPLKSSYVVSKSREEDIKTPPKKSREKSTATAVPENLLELIPPNVWAAMREETKLTDEQLRHETALMIDRNLTKEGKSRNWIASWRNWLRSPYRKSQPIVAGSSNGAMPPEIARLPHNNAQRLKWEYDHRKAANP